MVRKFCRVLARPLTGAVAVVALAVAAVAVAAGQPAGAAPGKVFTTPKPWRVLDAGSPTGRIVAVAGGNGSSAPADGAGAYRSTLRAAVRSGSRSAACLTSAAIRGGHGITVQSVQWARGQITLRLLQPTCRGVQLAAAAGQFGFEVGARPEGTAKRPNLPRFPQTLATATRWQTIAGTARAVTVKIPPVLNQCSQNDVALLTQSGVSAWPRRMLHLGEKQPQGVAYYVGNGKGCTAAPAVRAEAHCPTECTGAARVTFSAATKAPYGTTTVRWLDVATGKTIATVKVNAAHPARVTVPVSDGTRFQAVWSLSYGGTTREAPAGGVVEVRCPPAPEVALLARCLCAIIDGVLVDDNQTRYDHVITLTVQNRTVRTTVAAHTRGNDTHLQWPRGVPVLVVVQSQLGGKPVGKPHIDSVLIK